MSDPAETPRERDAAEACAAALRSRIADAPRPFLIGVSGSVAVGKSVFAQRLAQALETPQTPVAVVALDGFLFPGVTRRKGFPESFDRVRLTRFAADLRAGHRASAPVYSHETYDIVPGAFQTVSGEAIVILEGVIALDPALRPLLDAAVYLDADEPVLRRWYLERRAAVRGDSPEQQAEGERLWQEINLPNLRGPISAGRERADLCVHLGADHALERLEERWTTS